MSVWSDFEADFAAALVAAHAGFARLDSDLTDLDRITSGQVRYQLVGGVANRETREDVGSNVVSREVRFEIKLHYRLAASDAERDWTSGSIVALGYGLEDVVDTLLQPSFYRALASVFQTLPEALESEPTDRDRVGDVISQTVKGAALLTP